MAELDRDQRNNPQGMFMASINMEPFTKYLSENNNTIGIDTVANMLAEQLEADANEDELMQFIDNLVAAGATISEDTNDGSTEDTGEGTPIDDNGHPDTEVVDDSIDDEDYDEDYDEDEDDYEDWDDDDEEDLDYDKIESYAKNKPIANEPASDERVKSNKKPCADEPGKEVASDEKCKDKKGTCSAEKDDMMKFSDESLKNIIGALSDRIL